MLVHLQRWFPSVVRRGVERLVAIPIKQVAISQSLSFVRAYLTGPSRLAPISRDRTGLAMSNEACSEPASFGHATKRVRFSLKQRMLLPSIFGSAKPKSQKPRAIDTHWGKISRRMALDEKALDEKQLETTRVQTAAIER